MFLGFVDFALGFPENADLPLRIPSMKPNMNPPPMITLVTEKIIVIMPHAFSFADLKRCIIAPITTVAQGIGQLLIECVEALGQCLRTLEA